MIHPRARLALRLGGIDRRLAEASLTDDSRELAELGRGLGGFAFELCDGQAGFKRCTLREFRRDGVEAVGDAFEERRAIFEAGVVVAVECVVGELCCAIDFRDATECERAVRFRQFVAGFSAFMVPAVAGTS